MQIKLRSLILYAASQTFHRRGRWHPGLPANTIMYMNWTAFFLLGFLLHASAAGYSQGISLSEKQAPLVKLFSQIEKQSGYAIWYEKTIIDKAGLADIEIRNGSLEQALDICCKNKGLFYTIVDKMVLIRPKEVHTDTGGLRQISVNGKVFNEKDEPLAGATVTIKGSLRVILTNSAGIFRFNDVEPGAILLVTNVGYAAREIRADGKDAMIIRLSLSASKLDQVEVIGYGTTTRRYSTGSVSTVTSEEIEKQPVTNPLAAIQGRVPGIYIQTQNGLPGGNIKVQIRGQGSVSAGTDPLYVVDGVPFTSTPLNNINGQFNNANGLVSPLNSIPPSEIESIEILKDADATAIYGSRGANGVILINTKHGHAGDTKVSFNISQGISKTSSMPHYLGLKDYLKMRRQAFANDGVTPSADPNDDAYAPDLLVWDTTHATDWGKYIIGHTDHFTDLNASVSGGDNNTHFLFNANARMEGTVLAGNGNYKRFGGLLHVDNISKNQRFHSNFNVNYSVDNNNLPQSIEIVSIFSLPPNYPIYNQDGTLNWFIQNPISYENQKSNSHTENFLSNLILQYDILPGLDIKSSFGYGKIEMNMLSTLPQSSQNPAYGLISVADFGSNQTTTFLVEPQANYKNQFSNNELGILVGGTYQSSQTVGYSIEGTDYSNESLLDNLGAAGTISNKNNSYTEYKYLSLFSRISFTNSHKYLFSFNFRRDGSSKFGPGKQYGNFSAVGLGWIFSNERIVKQQLKFLSFGKIRGSYGITGNDQISPYQYLSSYSTNTIYQGTATLRPSRVANPYYQWESTKKSEIALELGFWKDRLLLTTAFYVNHSSNQLVSYPVPFLTGFSNYQANLPAIVENKGMEFQLIIKNTETPHFAWSTTFNVTLPKNKLISYPGLAQSSYANQYVVGKDLSIIKGFKVTGVNPQTGVAQFLDVNKDGNITNPEDFVVLGKTTPDFYGGFGNTITFRQFQFDLFLQFSKQHGLTNAFYTAVTGFTSNRLDNVIGWWQNPGDHTSVQKPTQSYSTDAGLASDILTSYNTSIAFINTSYLRVKNFSVSYFLPAGLLDKIHLKQAKITMQGQNIFTFCASRNIDPETTTMQSNIPVLKSFVGSVSITF